MQSGTATFENPLATPQSVTQSSFMTQQLHS